MSEEQMHEEQSLQVCSVFKFIDVLYEVQIGTFI